MLVVEDDPEIRKLLRKYLEKLSLEVLEAGTAKAALAVLQMHTPALVCLDLMLPESSGYDVCEKSAARRCSRTSRSWWSRRAPCRPTGRWRKRWARPRI